MKYLRGSLGFIVISVILNSLFYTIRYFDHKSVWLDPLCVFMVYILPIVFIFKNYFEKAKEKKTNILWSSFTILSVSILTPVLNEKICYTDYYTGFADAETESIYYATLQVLFWFNVIASFISYICLKNNLKNNDD